MISKMTSHIVPKPTHAICRTIPESIDCAVVQTAPSEPIHVDRARRQHGAYVRALESLGLTVEVLPADARFPDSCFVEDCAIVADGVALITSLGIASRRGEESAVATALQPHLRIETTPEPATLEGGDCLRLGRRLYVGLSQRTNAAGVRRLREVFEPLDLEVIEVALGDILHLKCVCSRLNDDVLLLAEGTISPDVFQKPKIILVPKQECYAANAVSVGGTVLLPAGFPLARRAIEAAGWRVQELEMSEIRKADGSMTCLSVLF